MDREYDEDVTIESERDDMGASEEDIEAAESRMGAKTDKIKKELELVKKERQEYLDGWQRAKADYVNALKRFDEERITALKMGARKASEAFLPALDSLERAEAHGEIPESMQGIARQLHDAVKSLGLEKIGMVGDVFDPALHDALGQDVGNPDQDNTISAVLEAGWRTQDGVIRPAKVRVYHAEG